MRRNLFTVTLLIAFIFLSARNTYANCWFCIRPQGESEFTCFLLEGYDCSDITTIWRNTYNRQCVQAATMARSNDNLIHMESDNSAWVMHDGKKTFLASDALHDFIAKVNNKYKTVDSKDASVQRQIDNEFSTFLKANANNHRISRQRVVQIAKESGFIIKENEKR